MGEILKNLGYDTENKSVGQIMNDLNEDPKFLYADTPDRKDIVVADYTAMVKEAQEVMVDYFVTMPKADVIVKASQNILNKLLLVDTIKALRWMAADLEFFTLIYMT